MVDSTVPLQNALSPDSTPRRIAQRSLRSIVRTTKRLSGGAADPPKDVPGKVFCEWKETSMNDSAPSPDGGTHGAHSLRDALKAAGLREDDAKRVAGSLSTMLAKSEGFGGLLREHELAIHLTPTGKKRPQWHLSDEGVQAVAAWAQARARGKLKPGKGSSSELGRIISQAKRGELGAAPRPAPRPEPAPSRLAPALPYSQSLLKLCKHFGLEPIFDGLTLNVEQIIIELARRIPDPGEKQA